MAVIKQTPQPNGKKQNQNLAKADRERLILRATAMNAEGLSFKEIGERLGISKSTIQYWLDANYRAKHAAYCHAKRATDGFREWNRERRTAPEYREMIQDRLRSDVQFRLATRLRSRLCSAVRGNAKRGSAVRDLGCSIEFLKQHLESQFQPGMSWHNWNQYGWHIDHKLPLASFDLTDREQLLVALNWRNLQPLWAADNIRKGAKIIA